VTHDVHIRTTDGGVQYPDALSYGVVDGVLMVQVGEDQDRSDRIYFSPNYWLQYSVDPYSDDPLDFDLEEFDDEDADDDYPEEDLEEGEDGDDLEEGAEALR
jgi:hypothetical protein